MYGFWSTGIDKLSHPIGYNIEERFFPEGKSKKEFLKKFIWGLEEGVAKSNEYSDGKILVIEDRRNFSIRKNLSLSLLKDSLMHI